MKIKNLFAIAALLLGSASASAQIYSGNFKIQASAAFAGKYEITDFSNDFVIPEDGIVTIPATLTNTSGDDYQIVAIADGAFANFGNPGREIRLDIKGVSFAKEIKYIGTNAFADFGNLATVTFAENSELTTIGSGAFAQDPMLKSISFANCPNLVYFTDNGLVKSGTNSYTTPFVNATVPTNTRLTSITLNTKTADFGLALQKIENLATVNIKDTKIRTLNGNALQGNKKITALELPAKPVYSEDDGSLVRTEAVVLADNALNGTAIATLTINGNVAANGIGALGVPMTVVTAPAVSVPALTTVTITGDVAAGGIKAGAFKDNTKLANVTIQGDVVAGAVVAGAFENAGTAAAAAPGTGIKLTVTASKAVNTAFDQKAFVAATTAADPGTNDVSLALDPDAGAPVIWRAVIVEAPADPGKIFVETNDNTTYFAKYHATAKISVKRGAGDIVVYSAYADGTNIYMDPLYSQADKYVFGATAAEITATPALANAVNVVIKVKGTSSLLKTDEETGKKYIEYAGALAGDLIGMRYKADASILNGIKYNAHITNQAVNAEAGTGNQMWALKKISTNGLKWGLIDNEGTFYINDAFYIEVAKPAPGARVNVIWLDEEGNTTAIQKVETKSANSDAIYNLRGEKVNAAYKGLVIKNGKKFIQK